MRTFYYRLVYPFLSYRNTVLKDIQSNCLYCKNLAGRCIASL